MRFVRTLSPAVVLVAVLLLAGVQPGAAPPYYGEWQEPVMLPGSINAVPTFGAAVTRDGLAMYCTRGAPPATDLYVSLRRSVDEEWGEPVKLDYPVNTALNEMIPALSRDEHWLFFTSDRPGSVGSWDLWVSWRKHTKDPFGWEDPVNLGLLAWAVGFSMQNRGGGAQPRTALLSTVSTLAVLPLRNLTGDASQDYLADGVTQGLSDRFSELGLFGVIASTSSAHYRDTNLPATQVARELGADALIEGTVARIGDRVRVSVSLVDGGSGQRVWSGRYEQPFGDVMALYDEIAATAAGEAKLAADAVEATRRARKPVDPGAYDEYLRAMSALGNRWMGGGCREAEPLLLSAIQRDRGFAPAHAALAWCYAYPARIGREISDVGPKAKAAVASALALDDRLALAHAVDGTLKWRVEYDLAAGQTALRRANELDPSAGLVMIPYAETFIFGGQPERGLPLLERAIRLDPFSPDRNLQVGFSLLMARQYGPAADRFRKAIELDGSYLTARLWLAEALAYAGQQDEAVVQYLFWLDGSLRPEAAPAARRNLEHAYATGGWLAFWRRELDLARQESSHPQTLWDPANFHNRYTGPWFMARRHARLANWNDALEALERAVGGRFHLVATMPVEPLFFPLWNDPRFSNLLRRTGVEPRKRPRTED